MRRGQLRDENLLMTHQFQQGQRQTQAAEERSQRSRARRAWDRVDKLSEECDELSGQVESLKEQLSRSKAFNRLVLIQNKGLIQAINHLKRSWEPRDQNEVELKKDINPLVRKEIRKVEGDAGAIQGIEQEIEQQTAPAPRRRTPRT